jgi:hypothetical protein
METPEIVTRTWQQLVSRLTARFNSEGYEVVQEHHHDHLYGSCFIMWSNNVDALRLTWDGKEYCYILEETELPITVLTPWKTIVISPFDFEKHEQTYANTIVEEVMKSLD